MAAQSAFRPGKASANPPAPRFGSICRCSKKASVLKAKSVSLSERLLTQPLARLLIVDDEAAQMKAVCDTLAQEGYATAGFTSPRLALAELREREFDLVVTDLAMPEMDGIAFLRAGQEIDRNLVGIVMTGHGAIETAVGAMQAGALDYIQKPFTMRNVLPVLTRGLTVRQLRLDNIQLRQTVAIQELSNALSNELNLQSIANRVADAAFQQSDGGNVSVSIAADDSRELRIVAARGRNAKQCEGMTIPFGTDLGEWVLRTRRQLADLGDPTQAGVARGDFTFDFGIDALSAAISVPMLAGGELIGILSLSSGSTTRATTLGQLKTLSLLARTAAAALQVLMDVTERKRAEQVREKLTVRLQKTNRELTRALKDREVLLQEVHHRVKNNLQVVSSLFSMQARRLPPGVYLDAFAECQTRVQAIALIHEKLYQFKDYSHVPFGEYARALVQYVFDAVGSSPNQIALELNIEDVTLPVARAIPCGLLLNELVTNSLKHGFKNGRKGVVRVELVAESDDMIRLTVKDDGPGLPANFNVDKSDSLGLRLIGTLAKQLDGELQIESNEGALFRLRFAREETDKGR